MMWWLAKVLRDAGLIVEEVAGWQDRGHGDVDPQVVVNHHTAGSPNGRVPSFSTCLFGVPGVPGPLCNVIQTREVDGPDHFIVIAAGNSYNAGRGGWAGYSGNWRTVGLEVEHTGVEWYPDHRRDLTWRFNAAVLNALKLGSGRSCQHFEWSTEGKIDIAQGVDPDFWRLKIDELQNAPEEDLEMRSMLIHKPGNFDIYVYDPANGTKTKVANNQVLQGMKFLAPKTGLDIGGPHSGAYETDAAFLDGLVEIT